MDVLGIHAMGGCGVFVMLGGHVFTGLLLCALAQLAYEILLAAKR